MNELRGKKEQHVALCVELQKQGLSGNNSDVETLCFTMFYPVPVLPS